MFLYTYSLTFYGVLNSQEIDQDTLGKVRETIKKSGALEYCENKVRELLEKGKDTLKASEEIDEETKKLLLGLADYVVTRNQ